MVVTMKYIPLGTWCRQSCRSIPTF